MSPMTREIEALVLLVAPDSTAAGTRTAIAKSLVDVEVIVARGTSVVSYAKASESCA